MTMFGKIIGVFAAAGLLAGVFYLGRVSRTEEVGNFGAALSETAEDVLGSRELQPVFEANLSELASSSVKDASLAVATKTPTSSKPKVAAKKESVAATPAAPNVVETVPIAPAVPTCNFDAEKYPSREVVLNEIAWMGNTKSAQSEWIELKNVSGGTINLRGWQIADWGGSFRIVFDKDTDWKNGALYLLERNGDASVAGIAADKIYTGDLSDGGMRLRFFNAQCKFVDEVDGSNGWPAGNGGMKQTLARLITMTGNTPSNFRWYTSPPADGTPKGENPELTATGVPPGYFLVSVAKTGSGSGVVKSSDNVIDCGATCTGEYKNGTEVTFTATSSPGSVFTGWTGACAGTGACMVTVSYNASIGATFDIPSSQQQQTQTTSQSVFVGEVFVGREGNASDEFIELYNPTSQSVDLTGWSIKKKSSTGSESSLVVASRLEGKFIPAGRHFLLINAVSPVGGTDVTWPESYTLAYTNNAVVLYDASGTKVEEVGWTEIPKGKSYVRTSWQSSQFTLEDPTPQNSSQ